VQVRAVAATLAVGATAFVVIVFGFAQVRVDRRQASEELVSLVQQEAGPHAEFVAFRDLEPSFIYYARRPIVTLNDPRAAADVFARNERAYLLASGEDVAELRRHLPADVDVVARRAKFLQPGEVVLLARTPQTLARRAAGNSMEAADQTGSMRR
jgi:hypothetical protein